MTEKAVAKEKLFFPNLDGLRFMCFFAVFVYHCNGILLIDAPGSRTKQFLNFLFQNGDVGVNTFFVLSGFLITYLLIREKKLNSTISLKNFYVRRILRIWPLFYIIVFLGFVIFPYIKFKTFPSPDEIANYWYYLFFGCNFDFIRMWPLLPDAAFISSLWSVAVEEQFYLSWPVILKYSSAKIFPFIFSGIIIFSLAFRAFHLGETNHEVAILKFHTFSVIGDMALGGMMAYYCSRQGRLYRFICTMPKWSIVLLYIVTITFILFKQDIFSVPVLIVTERLILAILFAFIIAEQNYAVNSFFKFSWFKWISKLGIYTYGLYCLHFPVISAVEFIFTKMGIKKDNLTTGLITSVLCLLLSIVVSMLSYHFIEKYFLKLKDKFSFIVKG